MDLREKDKQQCRLNKIFLNVQSFQLKLKIYQLTKNIFLHNKN